MRSLHSCMSYQVPQMRGMTDDEDLTKEALAITTSNNTLLLQRLVATFPCTITSGHLCMVVI